MTLNSTPDIQLGYDQHSRLSEYGRLVYPVVSRRSGGLSLGINLNPDKRCNFDCVYCQVDRAGEALLLAPDLAQLEAELRHWLDALAEGDYRGYRLQDIALAGDGEPTTVKTLPQVLDLLLALKREYRLAPEVKLVLFTNGSGLERGDLEARWKAFHQAGGEVWFKLDYWDAASLKRINRTRLRFERLIDTLTRFGQRYPVVLQSCFFRWQDEAFSLERYTPYVQLVERLSESGVTIRKIQAYTLARQPAEAAARPWDDDEMDRLAAELRKRLVPPVELFYEQGAEA
ncbi:radical SAM protein [Motiliproteus sp. SC1-56]|uniref:radical SAM protein n=1 Tax=Motiliproteus sp. SC1-56 TaxID=2799565 RepID=UPI001A8CFC64|nr:radical SAM protein [Motiliproteus sp. SC1-56]